MEKLKKLLKKSFTKVNVQASVLACGLIVFSCVLIYLLLSGVMMSLLADSYDVRASNAFSMVEPRINRKLYQADIPNGVYTTALSYLSAMRDNMNVEEIFIMRINDDGDLVCILDTNNNKDNAVVQDENVMEKVKNEISYIYTTRIVNHGGFYFSNGEYKYINFYPVKCDSSNIQAVICIGIDADRIYVYNIVLRVIAFLIMIVSCFMSVFFSNKLFKKISNPLYQDLSNSDALTGLKNKNSFAVDLHNIENYDQSIYSVVTIDLNGLKNINDTRGHQVGDIYIQRASKIIKSALNNTDFIGYRIGGDEFLVILNNCEIEDVEKFVRSIKLENELLNKTGLNVSMSIGYAKFDREKDRNFSMTIERADAMMYMNKRLYYKNKQENNKI